MMNCSKLYVTKIKYSKSLQSQRTKGGIKPVFILLKFFVNVCLKMEFNPSSTHSSYNYAQESNKKLQIIRICYSLSFLLWFIALYYSPIIQIAYVVHTHMQFKMIGE